MTWLAILKAIVAAGMILLFYFAFFYAIFEMRLDATKEGEILLWYTHYHIDGRAERQYIKLFRYKPTKKS